MTTKRPEYFYGCHLTEEQGDRILGIKAELAAEHGRRAAEELYEGAREGFCTLLGNEYVHDFAGELFIGGFLSTPEDSGGRKAIEDHLLACCGPCLSKCRFSVFRVLFDEEGEPTGAESL